MNVSLFKCAKSERLTDVIPVLARNNCACPVGAVCDLLDIEDAESKYVNQAAQETCAVKFAYPVYEL